ncbi:MAG: YybH family protein [Polyangiales bacterium]
MRCGFGALGAMMPEIMRFSSLVAALVAAPMFVACGEKPASTPTSATATTTAATKSHECEIWARDLSFAKSVADHDAKAFAEHILVGAVSLDEDGSSSQGREAIVAGWRTLLWGDPYVLVWYPTQVLLTSDPHIAVSRSDYYLWPKTPDADGHPLGGTFQSTWVVDADGVWRVAIHSGTTYPYGDRPDRAIVS